MGVDIRQRRGIWAALFALYFLSAAPACVWVDAAGWGSAQGENAPRVRRLWTRQLSRQGRWRFSMPYIEKLPGPTPVGEFSIPAVSEGRLYIGTSSGTARAFDVETGETLWEKDISTNAITCRPGVGTGADGGVAVFAGQGAEAVALDRETGEEKWRVKLGGPVAGAIEVMDQAAIFQDVAGSLYALDLATGNVLWRVRGRDAPALVARGFSGPVFDEDARRVFWGRWDGMLLAADVGTGKVLWRQSYAAPREERFSNLDTGLYYAGGSLWASQFDGPVYRLRADDGIASWNTADLRAAAGVAADVSRTYVPTGQGSLVALDSTLGTAVAGWGEGEIDPDWGVLSQPVTIFGSNGGGYLALSTTQGDVWSGWWWPPFFRYRPSGSVILVDPLTGKVVWRAKQLGGGFAGVFAKDGILASLSDRGVLQVWRVERVERVERAEKQPEEAP